MDAVGCNAWNLGVDSMLNATQNLQYAFASTLIPHQLLRFLPAERAIGALEPDGGLLVRPEDLFHTVLHSTGLPCSHGLPRFE